LTGFLLDTRALIWWNLDDPRLGSAARAVLADPNASIFVSSVSAFEIANKHRLGKLPIVASLLGNYAAELEATGFTELPVNTVHALRAGSLPFEHRDPFDRLLIAQAQIENLALISNEGLFDATGVSRIWS
jgi:PIN domain nuclease of toxin-antitoxin system